MGPWQIATLCIVALAGLVAVVRLTRHKGTRAAPRRPLDATPAGWGSMTLDPDPEAPSRALEVAHEDCWAGLPDWARPSYPRQAPYGWESGAGTARPGGGWDDHEWDPWNPDPHEPELIWGRAGGPMHLAPEIAEKVRGQVVNFGEGCCDDPYGTHAIEAWAAGGFQVVWDGEPYLERLADTGDVMDARLAADVAAELHRQDADAELFLVGLAERARELAAGR